MPLPFVRRRRRGRQYRQCRIYSCAIRRERESKSEIAISSFPERSSYPSPMIFRFAMAYHSQMRRLFAEADLSFFPPSLSLSLSLPPFVRPFLGRGHFDKTIQGRANLGDFALVIAITPVRTRARARASLPSPLLSPRTCFPGEMRRATNRGERRSDVSSFLGIPLSEMDNGR